MSYEIENEKSYALILLFILSTQLFKHLFCEEPSRLDNIKIRRHIYANNYLSSAIQLIYEERFMIKPS